MSDTHTANEPEPQASPATEDKPAEQKSLDDILNQYKPQETPAPVTEPIAQPAAKPNAELDQVVSYMKKQQEKDEQAELNTDLASAVKIVKGDDLQLSDAAVNDVIFAKFSRDKRLLGIWNDRNSNPGQFQDALKAIGTDLRSEPPVDSKLTEDRATMRAAVSGTTSAPEAKEFGDKEILDLPKVEFEKWMEDNK